ncbi:MAG: hypothetical protein P8J27_00060 [Mariniblastus sp.]|nr:hypothetical protein [Mariniblastus sp.]
MKLKLRQDLEFIERTLKLDDCWVVKDPISFNHFLFSSREFQLLQLFDGVRTDEAIQRIWQEKYRTKSLSIDQIGQFKNRLVNDNLVSVEEFGYGQLVFDNQGPKITNHLKNLILSPLVIRLRGVNPKPLLDFLSWVGWILFHPAVVCLVIFAAVLTLLFILGNADELAYRIPTISQFLSTQSMISFIISISIVKILHELGHAMACRRCGGECFEIGLIFLAFIPTLYCNVSDAWTFRERWKRLLVSFGGIYIEIIIASIAALIWMSTGPGLLNAMMFNIVLLCSINTVLINGNPLLRYDGYYMLSDLTEQPNLSQISKAALDYQWNSLFRAPKHEKTFPRWIMYYSILSFVYRWFVLGSIMVMVYVYLKSMGLRVLGQYVIVFLSLGLFLRPLMSGSQKLRATRRNQWGRLSLVRSAFPISIFCLVVALFFCLPIPSHVRCNFLVEAESPTLIYAPSRGKLTFINAPYQPVHSGQTVALIDSVKINEQLREVKNKLNRAQNNLEKLKLRENSEPLVASQIAVTQKNIESSREELKLLADKHAKLTVQAPVDGVLIPAGIRTDIYQDASVKTRQGRPTDKENLNCFVERGEELFSIVAEEKKTVTLFIGEREIDFVKSDQKLKLMFVQQPGDLFDGLVGKIYEVDVDLNQKSVGDIGLETYQDAAGKIKSSQTPYRVTVKSTEIPTNAFAGSSGRARISIPPQTLAQKTKDFFERLAEFEL